MAPKLEKMSFFFRSNSAWPSEESSKEEGEEEEKDAVEVELEDLAFPWRMLSRFSTVIESEKAVDGREGGGMKSPPGMIVSFSQNISGSFN